MKIRRRRKSDDEETSYWLSYSDMMAGLLLIFVLIIAFTMLQAKSQYEAKETELAEKVAVILSQQTELSDKETLLEDQQTQLDDQKTQLEEQQGLLADQQAELEEQKSVLESLQEVLANQEQLLADKEALVTSQQEQLEAQQLQLDKIIGVKAELINALKEAFESTSLSVSVDSKTGSIVLDSNILFDTEDYELSEAGEEFLREFVPVYTQVLLSPEFKDYVSEIIIEGHTDTDGTYIHNLELSQQRALAVASFCLEEENEVLDPDTIEELRQVITANGRSYSDPIYYDGTNIVNYDASRRVEFKFRLNDEEMVQEMRDILDDSSDTESADNADNGETEN